MTAPIAGRCHSVGRWSSNDITSYQACPRKGRWPTMRAQRRQAWGLRARTGGAAATEAWAARNTMRLAGWLENGSNVCG